MKGTVATVLYREVVTSDMIMRILLGGMHPNVRAPLPVDWVQRLGKYTSCELYLKHSIS